MNGHIVDVSEDGMRIEVQSRVEERTYASFRADGLQLHGSGSVRRCVPKGLKYYIGVEFLGSLRWRTK